MIRSFRNKALRLFAQKGEAKGLSVPNMRRVRQVLLALEAAGEPDDLNQPGFRFHRFKGERRGTYAVDASANDRITFRWDGSDAIDVDLEDHH